MSLQETFVDELRDLYSAETQLVKALPKIVKACKDEELATSISDHLEETKGHVERLKQIFEQLGEKPTGEHCKGMEGLLAEGKKVIEEDENAPFGDIMLIGASSRVEHYEIAGYSAAIAIGEGLGETDAVELLNQTLQEEQTAAETLSEKAKELIAQAAGEGDEDADSEEEEEEVSVAKKPTTAKKSAGGKTKVA